MEAVRPEKIVKGLCAAGFPAYYVGGCVRDRLLGRPVHDWDVTTAALPEEVMALFEHCVPTGIRHGTVTVFLDGAQAEVTTFRTEGVYLDGRHPSEVRFVRTLAEDLSRRDFTINAMAMDADGNVTDLFGGRDDLARRCIRCVGDPEKRFREDALRMLRAYRFSAQLGFALDAATAGAVERCAPLAAALSMERIRDEMEKTLLSPRPPVRAAGIGAWPREGRLPERGLCRSGAASRRAAGAGLAGGASDGAVRPLDRTKGAVSGAGAVAAPAPVAALQPDRARGVGLLPAARPDHAQARGRRKRHGGCGDRRHARRGRGAAF